MAGTIFYPLAPGGLSRRHDESLNDSIRIAQRSDPFCKPIIYFLESDDPNALPQLHVPLPEFDLRNGILVRQTYITSKQGPNRDVTQIVVPTGMVKDI